MRTSLVPALLLMLLTALAFWPARTAPFLSYDDPGHVTQNPYILPPTPARLAYFWRYPLDRSPVPGVGSAVGKLMPPYQEIYSPLAFTTWGLLVFPAQIVPLPATPGAPNGALGAFTLDPSVYHTFNLGLHVLNVLLVFALLRQFVKQEWAAALGSALFALHPVQVEAVAWVTGMNNLLSAFFALLALLFYLKDRDVGEKPRWGSGAYWGSTFCFLLSVLSKPSSVTLPALALLLCWGLGEKKWRVRLLEMVPWAAVALFCVAMNMLVARGTDPGLKPMSWQRPFLVGDALTFYGAKLFFPWHMAPDYGRRPEWVLAQPLTYAIWLLPVSVSVLAWLWWRRSLRDGADNYVARAVLLCLAIFVVVLLPTSGIITYYFHRISTVSDRYMYMALIGPALLVAVAASRCSELENRSLQRVFAILSLGLVATITLLSFRQTTLWQNELSLWSHNIAVNPLSTVAYYPYGIALGEHNENQKSISILEQGIRVNPKSALLELGLGNAYYQVQDFARAQYHYRRALAISPSGLDAHLNLGVLLSGQGQIAAAMEQFDQGLQLQPENPTLLAYMGLSLTKVGQSARGADLIRSALQNGFDPSSGHLYLGNALAQEGKSSAAMGEWYTAMQFDSNNYEACFQLGVSFAKMGRKTQAIQFLQRAVQIQPNYSPAVNALKEIQ